MIKDPIVEFKAHDKHKEGVEMLIEDGEPY